MKKILIILVISFISILGYSQVVSSKYDARVHLNLDERNYEDCKSEFEKAERTMKVGMGITFSGLGFATLGIIIGATSSSWDGAASGAVVFMLGGVLAIIGTPIWIAGGVKRHNNKKAMQKAKAELSFGSTKNGIGLKLSF